jgi:hypothetical protein
LTASGPAGSWLADGTPGTVRALDEADWGEVLDRWMPLPESRQWAAFDRDYLQRYPADSRELADRTRRFIAANLNGVFYMTDAFAMAFDYVEELYYKRPIYDALAAYAARHPGTWTAAEMLFSLADAYDFERRTLQAVAAAEGDARDILANRARRTSAYDFKAKAYVLRELAGDMRADLKRRGLTDIAAAASRYHREIQSLYAHLAARGGEIRNRALYASGLAFWDEGRVEDAFAAWREVEPGYPMPAFQRIKTYLLRRGDALAEIVPKVGEILAAEQGGSRSLLQRRLRYHAWTARAEALPGEERP